MGRMVDIDFHFGQPIAAGDLLQSLLNSGVSLIEDGAITFHLTDDFDWETRPAADVDEVLGYLAVQAEAGETVGVEVHFEGSSLGGTLLVPAESTVVYFILSADRMMIDNFDFTDFSWYLARVIPPFSEHGMTGFECHDFYPR
ncbi:hypothetical protein [Nocardia sp. NPDC058705]|uniref:hypothetical protein n=1 Tax=Nocardia sp. NPDC058705 TaxID=3346609 RepID=UPI0036B45C00